jgi:hypothetical protein
MYALLLVLILILLVLTEGRERFALIVGGRDWFSFDGRTEDGYEIFNTTPNTCPPDKPQLDAGLCYPKCRTGYRGVGPVCWAESENVGVGIPVELEPCPDGWNNDGLICREPIRNDCSMKGLFGECWGRLSGGRLKGRLDGGGICKESNPDRVDGLCYRRCPKDKPERIKGMPYLCYAGGDLSYGRGVGAVPSIVRVGRVWNPF